MLKKLLFPLALAVCLSVGAFAADSVKPIAVVNNEAIFSSDIQDAVTQILSTVAPAERTQENINKITNMVLQQKISEIVIKQEIKKQKITVTQKEIQDAIDQIKKANNISDADFEAQLKKEGISRSDFNTRVGQSLAAQKLIRQNVASTVKQPTDAQIKEFWDKIQLKRKDLKANVGLTGDEEELATMLAARINSAVAEKAAVSIIIVNTKGLTGADLTAATNKVNAIKKAIASGESFADIASRYNTDQALAQRGGDLGTISKGDLQPALDKAVFALPVGGVTKEPVKTADGYYFFKVSGKQGAREKPVTLDEVKDDIRNALSQLAERQATIAYIEGLVKKASIKINTAE